MKIDELKDTICEDICKYRQLAFEEIKDPDDAERWLDKNYCSSCVLNEVATPNEIARMQELWERRGIHK